MNEAENNDLIWKTDSSSVEIRFQGRLKDGRPALDEVALMALMYIWNRWTMTSGGWEFN
jgi:hypothetical protein